MSALHPEFDHTLLERDAPAFFSLDPGWDAPALKRAYPALIRRWKPERFPEEFKRVRAAYDFLRSAVVAEAAPVVAPPVAESSGPAVSERLESGDAESLRAELESRERRSLHEDLALAYLRAPRDRTWPPVCSETLAAAWRAHAATADVGCLVAAVERALACVPPGANRDALERFACFESTPVYFDITGDLWIAFSKVEPAACLMRVARMVHFSEACREPRHGYWLLRFCVAGAMRLPPAWIREQIRHLCSLPGFVESATPASGRLAAHSLFGLGSRQVAGEIAFLESLLTLRAALEHEEVGRGRVAALYRYLLRAYCAGDADALYAAWVRLSRLVFDDYSPLGSDASAMVRVMERLRNELDSAVAPRVLRPAGLFTGVSRFTVLGAWIVSILLLWLSGIIVAIGGTVLIVGLVCVLAAGEFPGGAWVASGALGVAAACAWWFRVWLGRRVVAPLRRAAAFVSRRYHTMPFDLLLFFARLRWVSVSRWMADSFPGSASGTLFNRLAAADAYRLKMRLFH